MHIQSDFDQHNVTHSTASMVKQIILIVSMYVFMHLAFKELKIRTEVKVKNQSAPRGRAEERCINFVKNARHCKTCN